MRWKLMVAALAVTTVVLGGYVGAAGAETQNKTIGFAFMRDGDPDTSHPNLWYRSDTRTGGGVNLTKDFSGPEGFGDGALALTTNGSTNAKAQLYNTQINGTALSDVSQLSYNTYHDASTEAAGGFDQGDPALQLVIDYNGGTFQDGGFTTITFEPYVNGTVTPNVWQAWEADEGQWYTSRKITCGDYSLDPGQGDHTDTLGAIATGCPDASVYALGVNIGSNNPNYVVATDGIHVATSNFDVTYDFQPK